MSKFEKLTFVVGALLGLATLMVAVYQYSEQIQDQRVNRVFDRFDRYSSQELTQRRLAIRDAVNDVLGMNTHALSRGGSAESISQAMNTGSQKTT